MLFAVLSLLLLMTSLGMSQYFARESFNYPQGDSLTQVTGLAINGFAGSWTYDNGTDSLCFIGKAPLVYSNLNYTIANIGNHLTFSCPGNWVAARYQRQLDKTWPNTAGKVYWTSLIMDVEDAHGVPSSNTYYCFKLFSGSSELLGIGKSGGGTTYSAGSGWAGGSGPDVSTTNCLGGPVWLVAATYMTGGASCRTFMWINPDPTATSLDTNVADVKRPSGMPNGFDNVRVECGGNDTVNVNFDEIRLGDSWASVSAAPYYAIESFNYAKGASIDTLMGGAQDGWAGSWYKIVSSKANSAVVADTGLPYSDLNYSVSNVGRHLEAIPDTAAIELRYGRNLAQAWPNDSGKVYWMSVLMDVKQATDNSTWLGVKLFNGASGELCMLGKGHGLDKYTCGGGWHGGPGNEVSTTAWTVGPVWLVGKIVMKGTAVGASMDTVWMWISPDPTAGEPAISDMAAYTAFKFTDGFNVVRVEFGGTVGTGLRASFDEIRLGTSWGDVSSSLGTTGVAQRTNNLPAQFALAQNYPNPFNPSTSIIYSIKNSGKVSLSVYNLLGQKVAVLVDGVQNAGSHNIVFSGNNLSSGIYFYRLESASQVITKKMLLMK